MLSNIRNKEKNRRENPQQKNILIRGVPADLNARNLSPLYSNIVILNKLGLARQKKGHNCLCHTLFNYNIVVITFVKGKA
jgi:hypothetical protein